MATRAASLSARPARNTLPALSPGRVRALEASSTPEGIFTILAIDHRDSLRAMVNPVSPASVPASALTEFKLAVVRHVGSLATAVLLDPLYGAAQAIAAHVLPGSVGLLCALEEQGYLGDPLGRETPLLSDWNVEKAKRLGATGVKIFLFYNPSASAADKQDALVRAVLRDCANYELPLFLEPISYPLDLNVVKGSAEFARERRRIVIESVRRLGALSPDVLKVEFPVDVKHERDERVWADACAELNATSPVPWALLSADEPFDVFERQVRVACENGCSGFLAGRAVWREGAAMAGAAREEFLAATARARFEELAAIAREHGTPWHTRYAMPEVDEEWYRNY